LRARLVRCDAREIVCINADATEAKILESRLNFAEMSHANLTRVDFAGSDLFGANLHAVTEDGTRWGGANLKQARRTDKDLLEAETWFPPRK
jgi:uncharacterized protein YjbI with pentapeptide repeats